MVANFRLSLRAIHLINGLAIGRSQRSVSEASTVPAYRVFRLEDGQITAGLRIEADDVDNALARTREMLGADAAFEVWDRQGLAAKFPAPAR